MILTEYLSLHHQFVAATQPINSIAFVFDGVNYGASDFAYTAYSMVNKFLSPCPHTHRMYKYIVSNFTF